MRLDFGYQNGSKVGRWGLRFYTLRLVPLELMARQLQICRHHENEELVCLSQGSRRDDTVDVCPP